MTADEILALQRKQPFMGFRIYLSDGESYEVPHPERMVVTRSLVFIALSPRRGRVPERSVYCDPEHITSVEPLNGSKRRRSRKQAKS